MYRVYQVQDGETIDGIAKKLGTESQTIIDLNSLKNEVRPGQLLVVPNIQDVFTTYTVGKGETIYEIAKKYNANPTDILMLNGLDKDDFIYPNQQIMVPKEGVSIYITKQNETIKDVSEKLGVGQATLLGQNETLYLIPDQLIIYKK